MDEYTVKDLKSRLTAHLMALDLKAMRPDELKIYAETVGEINKMDKEDVLSTMVKTMGEMYKPVGFGNTRPGTVTSEKLGECCCCTRAETEVRNDG